MKLTVPMKVAIGVGGAASGRKRDWDDHVTFVSEADRLGVDVVWSAEAWGQDAVVPLGYRAATTNRIRLGTGIMQISARAPAMTAMTAMTLAAVSGNRFICGLGVSGPQVVEGLHGVPFSQPLTRLRETVEILKLAFAGEKIEIDGDVHVLPRRGGEGKALRLAQPANDAIPIYLATLGPKALEFTGEVADGWVGTSFTPENAEAMLDPIRRGAERAGRSFGEIDIQVGGTVEFGEDLDELMASRRPGTAFSLGAMGSATTNFYNDAYSRGGFAEEADEVRKLWVAGRRDEAIAAVPDELVLQTNLLGTDEQVSARIRAYRDAGVTTLRVAPEGDTLDARLETLSRVMDLTALA